MTVSELSENWATLWEALAAAQPDQVAVVIGDARIRWGDFDDAAARAAAALNAHGVGLHDRVAQLLYNCPEYLYTTYASFKLRAATVNVNYRYKAPEIVHVLGDAGAKALVFHGAFAEVVDEARKALPELELLVQVDGGDDIPLLPGAISYEELLDGFQPMPPIERAGTDTQLLYTGGTTGLPKGVVWTHAGLFGAMAFTGYGSIGVPVPTTANEVGRVAAELSASGRSPVNMTAPPLMHGTGLFLAFSTFVLGGRVVLLAGRRFDAGELLHLVQREGVTQLSVVGDAFARPIVAELERSTAADEPYDLSSLARIVSSGATMSADIKRDLRRAVPGATILDLIGASEGGPFAISVTAPGQEPLETAKFMATPATVVFDDQTWEPIPWGSGRTGVLAVVRPRTRQLLPPTRGHGEGVPGDRRSALLHTWRLRHHRRRRAGTPVRPRLRVHQHRRREGVPRRGGGGGAEPPGHPRLCRRGHARRAVRPTRGAGGVTPAGRRDDS